MYKYLNRKILGMVCEKCPAPNQLTEIKIENLLCPPMKEFSHMPQETLKLKSVFSKCCPDDTSVPIIAFVSKMFPVCSYLFIIFIHMHVCVCLKFAVSIFIWFILDKTKIFASK